MKKHLLPLMILVCLVSCPVMASSPEVVNVSTRGAVMGGDNVMIGGFIISGSSPKTVIIRAIGPSLTAFGVPNVLADPTLEVHDSTSTIARNDNWQNTQIGGLITSDQVAAIQNSGLAPNDPAESVVILTLPPGNYTAIVGGNDSATPRVGLVEVYAVTSTQHLYIANDNTPGGVQQFDLPLSPTSTPNFTIAGNDLVAVGLDSNGDLATGDFHHKVFIFTAPLSGFSTPSATFNNGTAGNTGQLTFVPSGPELNQLWSASVGTEIDRFVPLFTNATTPVQQTFPTGASQLVGLVFDSSLNMYVSNVNNIYVFTPPYNNPPAVVTPTLSDTSYRKEAVSGNQLFVAMPVSTPQPRGRVDVYNLPLSSSSTPAFSIIGSSAPENGVDIPEALAFDAVGNLYVGNLGGRSITVYAPPFSAASTPTVTLTLPAPYAVFGIWIGK